jgi:hypothetical protein
MIRIMVFAIALLSWSQLYAEISGTLLLKPDSCQSTNWCWSVNPLSFTDSHSNVWKTKDSLKTDGASIPKIFQGIVGKPFDTSYIKAAIIHDHYCDRHVRPWRQTHRVFYEALISQKLPKTKAKLMYYAVFLGGPKWTALIPGKGCGNKCIQKFPIKLPKNGYPEEWGFGNFKGMGLITEAASYESPSLEKDIEELKAIFERNPDTLNVEELENRAISEKPDDFYFTHGDTVVVSSQRNLIEIKKMAHKNE